MAFKADVHADLVSLQGAPWLMGSAEAGKVPYSLVLQIGPVASGQKNFSASDPLLPSPPFAPYLKNSLFIYLFVSFFIHQSGPAQGKQSVGVYCY